MQGQHKNAMHKNLLLPMHTTVKIFHSQNALNKEMAERLFYLS